MATRTQIGVKGSDVLIYKHWDGYPSETLPTLEKVTKQFYQERGNDPRYCPAQIMRAFARRDDARRKDRFESLQADGDDMAENYAEPEMTGWGLMCGRLQMDIEWFYWVDLENARLEVYECRDWDYGTVENLRDKAELVEDIELGEGE